MKIIPLNNPIGSSYLVDTLREAAEENAKKQEEDKRKNERERSTESQKKTQSEADPTPDKELEGQILDTEKLLKLLARKSEENSLPATPFKDGPAAKRLTLKNDPGKKV